MAGHVETALPGSLGVGAGDVCGSKKGFMTEAAKPEGFPGGELGKGKDLLRRKQLRGEPYRLGQLTPGKTIRTAGKKKTATTTTEQIRCQWAGNQTKREPY
jgi:hypothetical protein